MRKPFLFTVVFSAATFLSINVQVSADDPPVIAGEDLRWNVLSEDEKRLIDRIAADFFEGTLRTSQTSAIEDSTASVFIAGDREQRSAFVEQRREQWRAMSEEEQRALRGSKTPKYNNLTEAQKAPFRRHALDVLDAQGAINESALTSALRREV